MQKISATQHFLMLSILQIIVITTVALGAYTYGRASKEQEGPQIPVIPIEQMPVACTEEAKICPDGSAVGRSGPKCEFAPCPGGEQIQTEVVCPARIKLPNGYRYQTPLNSFYGLTLKDGEGKVCDVILGPNYKSGYEGFSGEQIQINAYRLSGVTPEMILAKDGGTLISNSPNQLRYTRAGYGGDDEIIISANPSTHIQMIWRAGGTTSLEPLLLSLLKQITPN